MDSTTFSLEMETSILEPSLQQPESSSNLPDGMSILNELLLFVLT